MSRCMSMEGEVDTRIPLGCKITEMRYKGLLGWDLMDRQGPCRGI
jgi:hypothetical protein